MPKKTESPSPSIALVKQALAERGMRQQELANRTGLSKDHLSRILLAKVSFPRSRDTLNTLASALGLDPLLFQEYRAQLQVLPESTRRLVAHLKERGISQSEFIRRIPDYSEGHLQLILRGGSPFPKDPETIRLFASAAEVSPFLFSEYLPLSDWRERLAQAAEEALDKADAGVFSHLLAKIQRHFEAREAREQVFDERLLQRFMARSFGPSKLPYEPELDDALTYLPPLSRYQSEVRLILRAMYKRGLTVRALASLMGGEEETLFALLKGQMKLKEGPVRQKLLKALDVRESDIAEEEGL